MLIPSASRMVLAVAAHDTSGLLKKIEVDRRSVGANDVDIEIHYAGIVQTPPSSCTLLSLARGAVVTICVDCLYLYMLGMSFQSFLSLKHRDPQRGGSIRDKS